jgi:hypothetical protein
MTARERIDYELDLKAKAIEIGAFCRAKCTRNTVVAHRGVVVKIGYTHSMANADATVSRFWFLLQFEENLRAQEIAFGKKPPANHLFGR